MSDEARAIVYVDRNAIWENDRDGGDRPVIIVEHSSGQQDRVHEIEVNGLTRIVQNGKSGCKCQQNRPHVWLEVFGPYRCTQRERQP